MNRLQFEKSPYLLQHKNNPVDWYPWGEEAFEKAKKENKPVFLSVGYATCHWCHVMEHESFEDEEIASLMNQHFVNVKVDREERPDIDSTYMTVCQMVTGHGGWPLTIIMTPEKRPFFAGTYIPKEARFQRLGLRQLIPGISGMWKHEPEKIKKAVQSIQDGFDKSLEFEKGIFPGMEAVHFAAEQLTQRFDDQHGGFGSAPKFPSPHNLTFLLRQWHSTKEERFKHAVEFTLKKMRLGGLWDHLGFGFHRYSTDQKWLLPHFEKMLYDQALMMIAYTEGWQVSKEPLFHQTVLEIASYVKERLTHEDGAFFSAEDADTDGEEGKFYVWSTEETEQLLTKEEQQFFVDTFNFEPEGNFEDEATHRKTGKNVPFLEKQISGEKDKLFQSIRKKLLSSRNKRTQPLLDDKILTDWNALMIVALAKASRVFDHPEFVDTAEKAFSFIQKNLWENGNLKHRYKDGKASISAFADDYAFLIWATLELYETTHNPDYLASAIQLSESMIDLFWDNKEGGFFFTQKSAEQLLGRQKQIYDGAIPSSNSVAINCLIKLSRLTGITRYEDYADKTGQCFSSDLLRSGSSITKGLQSIQFLNGSPKELVVVNNKEDESMSFIKTEFLPFMVSHLKNDNDNTLNEIAPYTKDMRLINRESTYYLCSNMSCDTPTNSFDEIRKKLSEFF